MKEDIYTIPNILTFGRLLAAPVVGYLILEQNYNEALGLFAIAGFTDMVREKRCIYIYIYRILNVHNSWMDILLENII